METAGHARRVLHIQTQREGYILVANLPKNRTSLAVRAEEAGADAIMVNIEGDENGFAGHFGNYELHEAYRHRAPADKRRPIHDSEFRNSRADLQALRRADLFEDAEAISRSDIPAILSLGVRGLVIDASILSGAEEAYRDEIAGFSPRREVSEQGQ